MSKMKKIHKNSEMQSRDVIHICIESLQAINNEVLTSEYLQSANHVEINQITILLNRNNRVIDKLKEEVTV